MLEQYRILVNYKASESRTSLKFIIVIISVSKCSLVRVSTMLYLGGIIITDTL